MAAEQQLVSLQELDRLVLGYLAPEGEAAGSDAALAAEVEALVLGGAAGAALERLRAARPALLDNQRLLFTLQQWHFLDLAGSADPAQHNQAIALVRAELAPLALTAFPEAYAELKHSMLQLLIQPPSPTGRPGAGTGLPAPPASARREAAGMLGRTLREVLVVRQQPLSVLLRYLLLVLAQHKDPMPALARPTSGGPVGAGRGGGSSGAAAGAAAASGAGTSSSGGGPGAQPTAAPLEAAAAAGNEEEDLDAECRRLLLAWRDPMPLPRDAMHGGPARFPEVQVQALRTSLGCDREEAVALMRQSGGNVSTALRSAVQATRLDESAVQQLAQQYAIFRGLDFAAPLDGAQQLDPPAQANGSAAAGAAAGSAANGVSPSAANGSNVQVPSSVAAAQSHVPQAAGPGAAWVGQSAGEAHPAKMARRSALDPSVGLATRQAAAAAAAAMDGLQQGGEAAGEGRARTSSGEAAGPPAAPAPMPATTLPNGGQRQGSAGGKRSAPEPPEPVAKEMAGLGEAAPSVPSMPSTPSMSEREVHDAVARLRRLLGQGLLDEAEQLLQGLSPGFAQRFPEAAFLMRRCQLLRLLCSHGGQDGGQCRGPGAAEGATGLPQATAALGGTTAALAFVRSHLSPLAQQHPQLQPLLKASLAALLPATGLPSTSTSPAPPPLDLPAAVAQAAAAVHASLQQQFQIREPRLLRLLGHLLVTHSAHFMAQRCKDGFEGELGIPQLRGLGVVPAAEQQWRSTRQATAAGAAGGGGLLSALLARRRSQDGGRAAAGAVIVESSSDEELPLSPYQPAAAAPPGQRAQMVQLVHEAEALMERMQRLPHLAYEVAEPDEMEEDQEEDEGGSEDGLGMGEEGEGWQHAGQPGGGGNGNAGHAAAPGLGGEGGNGGAEGVSEEAILLTQEFSGLPRRQAIELLLVFGGSPQAVMAHLFP